MEWCKIMIVDDEYLLRQGIIHMLEWEKYGFKVVGEATNATQTLELIEKIHPHIILCDIVMPNIDGIELSKIIKKRYPNIEIVILSGYDNFEYVKTAFKHGVADYVLKPTLTANQLLDILIPLQKKFVKPVCPVEEKNSMDEQLLKMLEDKVIDEHILNDCFNKSEFTIIGYQQLKSDSVDNNLVNDKIKQIFSNFFCIYIGKSQDIHIFIINHDKEDINEINDKWDLLTNSLKPEIITVFLMKIEEIGSYASLLIAYDEIKNLSQYHFYGYEQSHISISFKTYKTRNKIKFDTKQFMQLASSEPVNALEYLEDYLEKLTFQNGLKGSEIKAIVQNVIYNLFNIILINEEKYEEVNTKKIIFFNNISNATTLEDIIEYFNDIKKYIESLIEVGTTDKMMKQILDYININYEKQINLQEIANEFHISYSYLSAYFNNNYKESFNDYLNRVRIQKAKEFLVNPSIQISYVSELVGYSSPNYFTKVFKKLTGYTPTTYRRMYMK
ncbi:DNA-binding response regulator [Vallitalea longa]|uniref:Stage 0 sporulation protein A homolog n=1 Tax=Vallitalea longa TaxID=2936439 RepID=A0A9W5YGQ9_9FIRM|nr:response regulator [Vallitalea longa]GKX31988.1 DNA-binding response regulator [Vallitalea longa]